MNAAPVLMITDDDQGCWAVTTETSIYEIDLDAGTARRRSVVAGASELRRDAAVHHLYRLEEAMVGAPMRLVLNLSGDGGPPTFTLRVSTPVVAIERLSG